MAEVVDEWPLQLRTCALYPWDEWLDGKIRHLVADVDFAVQPQSMRRQFYERARERGLTCRTRLTDDGVMAQAFRERPGDLLLKAVQ